ncbi:MAG: hypothetical protein CVV44_06120 [Spirochaetae bacterium HGW-Spirochaetae-1]|jgi:hypothetical protein|nr:MAG: hypothetical protein CVV44_06120 [Spirochaetae bacterium HGW-Spirochaetae-1]
MAGQKVYSELTTFISELKKNGIAKIVFAVTSEKRAEQVDQGKLEVVFVRKAEVLAYKNAMLYKCLTGDADIDSLQESLEKEGFEVTRTSRNIT